MVVVVVALRVVVVVVVTGGTPRPRKFRSRLLPNKVETVMVLDNVVMARLVLVVSLFSFGRRVALFLSRTP